MCHFGSMRRTAVFAATLTFGLIACPPRLAAQEQPPAVPSGAQKDGATPATDAAGDLARKAEIMNSNRWRRAIFELGEWLSAQQIYSPQDVRSIKADFNRRVAGMSSYELEYLLDDLDAKFKILDTPEAKDARQWVGQYLAVMSDQRRAEVLKDVPDVVKMSSGQLQQEIEKLEQKKAPLLRHAQFRHERGRRPVGCLRGLQRGRLLTGCVAAVWANLGIRGDSLRPARLDAG